ncbi:MAG TPA: calcium-binding protein [Rhizomicrobium sp.]|nr:calcium-binding protein [Rhizomicrobium sp.]
MGRSNGNLSILDGGQIETAGSLSIVAPPLAPLAAPQSASPLWLTNTLPTAVFAAAGSTVNLSTILDDTFGAHASYGGYNEFWIAYYGASTLSSWDFSYWDLGNPQVTKWLINGNDIGPDFGNQRFIDLASLPMVSLKAGNDIGDLAYVTVPVAFDKSTGSPTEYQQFSVITVDPSMMSSDADDGAPTPQDIVDSAERFAAAYTGVPNDNDCHKIACALSAAVGAAFDDDVTYSLDPAENQSNGFWRVVYRGSDPNPVTDWQTLVHPGDIVRMGWQGGGQHTTTVLAVNGDGSIRVFDNADYDSHGTEIIGIHDVNYYLDTIPDTITIYRLDPNDLYLINGTGLGESLAGTSFNDQIFGLGGPDKLYGETGNDVLQGGAGSDVLVGGPGADKLSGGAGRDIFRYSSVSQSTGPTHDTITDFDASATGDRFDLNVTVKGIAPALASGTLRSGHFDTDLAAAVTPGKMGIGKAVLFTASAGNLSGHTFLIVDANGHAGYQAGADYVFDVTNGSHLGQLSVADFI